MSYVRFYSDASFTLKILPAYGKGWDGILEYSTNTSTWNIWDGTFTLTAGLVNEVYNLYLRGTGNTKLSKSTGLPMIVFYFEEASQPIDCEGNIESLLDYATVDNNQHPIMNTYAFASLFNSQSALRTAPQLPSLSLTEGCYDYMFYGTGLITAPELPATNLAPYCYYGMFQSCTSLITAPELPATNLASYCYNRMFMSCNSLITPPALPAIKLATYCYLYMFNGCTSLASIPELPATVLATRCYTEMFRNTNITLTASFDTTHINEFRIPTIGNISNTATDWNLEMFPSTSSIIEPDINTTYYVNVPVISSAIDYMVTKSELSSIASAIRGKTGNNISLTYPDDFISELNNIQPGEMTTFLSGSSLPANSLGVDGDFYTYTGS